MALNAYLDSLSYRLDARRRARSAARDREFAALHHAHRLVEGATALLDQADWSDPADLEARLVLAREVGAEADTLMAPYRPIKRRLARLIRCR